MGSNMSTVNGRKAPSKFTNNNAIIMGVPKENSTHSFKRCAAHRWTNTPPVKGEAWDANRELSQNFNKTSKRDDQYNCIEIIRSEFLDDHSANNANRVISFHSTTLWKEYFQASKHSDKLMVIFFCAKWCGYCRYMEPILNDLAAEYADVEFDKLDVDELYDTSREFKVHAMPTFLFIKRGKEVDKVIGTRHDEIQRKIEKLRICEIQ